MNFVFKGCNGCGELVEGIVDVFSSDVVVVQLMVGGVVLVSIEVMSEVVSVVGGSNWFEVLLVKFIMQEDVFVLICQFYMLQKVGVFILCVLVGLEVLIMYLGIVSLLQDVCVSFDQGCELVIVFFCYFGVFSMFYVVMICVGELMGWLIEVFQCLFEYLEFEFDICVCIKQVLCYLMMVIFVMGIVFVVINFFVLFKFVDVFVYFKIELLLMMCILFGFLVWMVKWWLLVLVGGIGVVLVWCNWIVMLVG